MAQNCSPEARGENKKEPLSEDVVDEGGRDQGGDRRRLVKAVKPGHRARRPGARRAQECQVSTI